MLQAPPFLTGTPAPTDDASRDTPKDVALSFPTSPSLVPASSSSGSALAPSPIPVPDMSAALATPVPPLTSSVSIPSSPSNAGSSTPRRRRTATQALLDNAPPVSPPPSPPRNPLPPTIAHLFRGVAPGGSLVDLNRNDNFSVATSGNKYTLEINDIGDEIKHEAVMTYIHESELPPATLILNEGTAYLMYDSLMDWYRAKEHKWHFGRIYCPLGFNPLENHQYYFRVMLSSTSPPTPRLFNFVRGITSALGADAKKVGPTRSSSITKVFLRSEEDFLKVVNFEGDKGCWVKPSLLGEEGITVTLIPNYFGVTHPDYERLHCTISSNSKMLVDHKLILARIRIELSAAGLQTDQAVYFGAKVGASYGFLLVRGRNAVQFLLDTNVHTAECNLSFKIAVDDWKNNYGYDASSKRRRY
jgi:hypothetical protein